MGFGIVDRRPCHAGVFISHILKLSSHGNLTDVRTNGRRSGGGDGNGVADGEGMCCDVRTVMRISDRNSVCI